MVDTTGLGAVSARTFDGTAFRHLAPKYDPRSGEGARLHGGRFNPPGSYPVLYLCSTRPCVVAELVRFGRTQAIGVNALLPRSLYRYRVRLTRVLDLTDEAVLTSLEITRELVVGEGWAATQKLGATAYRLGWQAVLAPSATGTDQVLALYPELLGSGELSATPVETWHDVEDLAPSEPHRHAENGHPRLRQAYLTARKQSLRASIIKTRHGALQAEGQKCGSG